MAAALARAYNNWLTDFCQTAPARLYAAAMAAAPKHGFCAGRTAPGGRAAAFSGVPSSGPCLLKGIISPIRTTTRSGPSWNAWAWRGAVVHPTPGLWNPEWTSHGPFIEKVKNRLNQHALVSDAGGGPTAGGGNGLAHFSFFSSPAVGHPVSPILSGWLDNHMFVASTLIGFTVMQRFPELKVVVAHGKASWMEEVLEKMEASTKTIPLLNYYPVRTDPEKLWEEGRVMLGFDAEERMIQRLPHDFAEKIVWGSRYPHHDTTSAWDAIETLTQADVEKPLIARMLGENAAAQFGIPLQYATREWVNAPGRSA